MIDIIETQRKLAAVALPSGFERPQAALLKELAAPYCDECFTDTLGNVICHKKGEGARVLFCAHMDVIGFMVNFADKRGFLRFEPLGGFVPGMLVGTPVISENGVYGAIFADAESGYNGNSLSGTDIHDLYIDIGAASREEALALCPVGSVFRFDAETKETANGCMISPYIDDLGGCVAMLIGMSLIKKPANDLWFAFTVQEEVGCRGAFGAAFRIKPQIALVVEGTTAADSPQSEGAARVCMPGQGPVIPFMDGGAIYDRKLFCLLRDLAEEKGIKWQTKTRIAGGTDAQAIQRTAGGCRVGAVSAAVRYIHSPSSVASLRDFEAMKALVDAFLEKMEVSDEEFA